ncbi:hypothetical protein Tco_0580671 [Tanacetum coccineum]
MRGGWNGGGGGGELDRKMGLDAGVAWEGVEQEWWDEAEGVSEYGGRVGGRLRCRRDWGVEVVVGSRGESRVDDGKNLGTLGGCGEFVVGVMGRVELRGGSGLGGGRGVRDEKASGRALGEGVVRNRWGVYGVGEVGILQGFEGGSDWGDGVAEGLLRGDDAWGEKCLEKWGRGGRGGLAGGDQGGGRRKRGGLDSARCERERDGS